MTLGAVALAEPASATTNAVKGTAECVDGRYVVEWTVTNQDPHLDEAIEVKAQPEKSHVRIADEIEAGKSITGKQVLPKGSTGIKDAMGKNVARLEVHGTWKDGDKVIEKDATADVPLPGKSCDEPEPSQSPSADEEDTLSADITLSCDVFSIDLTNDTDRRARFTVLVKFDDDKPLAQDFAVNPGKTLTLPDDLKNEDDFKALAKADDEDFDVSKIAVAVIAQGDKLDSASLDLNKCDEEEGTEPSDEASPSESAVAGDDEAQPSVSPASNSESEEGSLPVTGASLGGLIAGAVLVLGLGVGMVVFTRRRKRA
ncbi:hypothetical protein [Cryptosporangium phraense]|uniref:LPXTG cell wall anchor domain-containing protein n=1 Tax=Cryptosporangium phraense TaxID=2593070 RepID=A0A545ANM4_9ACTN|nr:hypothetical protein [Cryptosporangium phraense]TQS42873.1 hypothetical protein FL583_22780 [Cryptosporangium phraense]